MRIGSQPVAVGLPEKPWPGSDGITTSNASAALPPCAVGIGQRLDDLELLDDRAGPAVRDDQRQRVRRALERTWMKWMSTPSISVTNCGSAFSLASTLRQS